MSCGHAVTPESLTAWCRSLLDQVLGTPPCDLILLKCCVAPPHRCCGANIKDFIAMWDVTCTERVNNELKSEGRGKSSPGEPESNQVFLQVDIAFTWGSTSFCEGLFCLQNLVIIWPSWAGFVGIMSPVLVISGPVQVQVPCVEGRHRAEVRCGVGLSGGAPPGRPHCRGDAAL